MNKIKNNNINQTKPIAILQAEYEGITETNLY